MYFLSLGVTGLIWGACIRQMNCDTREQGMNQSIHSMNSSGFHSTKPSPGANYSTTNSHNSICCESGGNNRIWTIGNVINKNRTILYLIRPAEAAMEREQLRSRWNVDKIGGGNIADKSAFPNLRGRTILPPILTTLYAVNQGGITEFEPLGMLSTKTEQYYIWLDQLKPLWKENSSGRGETWTK